MQSPPLDNDTSGPSTNVGPAIESQPSYFTRGRLSRRWRNRSRYLPHQNTKECTRRLMQIINGHHGQALQDEVLAAARKEMAKLMSDELTIREIPEEGES